jgi:hypothetical protein
VNVLDDLAASYEALGEPAVVAGSPPIIVIFSGGQVDAITLAAPQRMLRCRASDAAAVTEGAPVVFRGRSFTVRAMEPVAPDELETMLILERVP